MKNSKWYRWRDTNPLTVTFDQWYEWKPLPKERESEILEYIERGYAYEIATVEDVSIVGYSYPDSLKDDPVEVE